MGTRLVQAGHVEAVPVVLEVLEAEADARRQRRVDRLRLAARLPPGKTFATLDMGRFPKTLLAQLQELRRGTFVDHAFNVLCIGLPGVGKSHAAAALGHELVEAGRTVLFLPVYKLVQDLLAAKLALRLPHLLRKLDLFELLILDDIGYVQQSADEAEVLFTLLAERYERRSVMITSNLMFTQWDRIFKHPMATAAAVDRLVHHATILEFTMGSFRMENAARAKNPPAPTNTGEAP
jgi:DNA replication protein DnaC